MYAETHSNIYQLVCPTTTTILLFFLSTSTHSHYRARKSPLSCSSLIISPIQQEHLPVVITKVLLQITRRTLLTRIILVVPTIMRVIQLLGLTFSLVLGLFPINVICSLGLGETIDFAACETREELFGELVGDGLACWKKKVKVSWFVVGDDEWGWGKVVSYPLCVGDLRTFSSP